MATTARPAAPGQSLERNFFLGFALACWLGVIMGFFPASSARLAGKADYVAPLILHIHAVAFICWMFLLLAQVLLVRNDARARHRKLGRVAMVLMPVMVLSGFFAEVYSQRFYLSHPPDSQAFFILPIYYVLAFGTLAGFAIARRGDPQAHKRLIYLATAVIAGAAYARWWGHAIEARFGEGYFGLIARTFAGTNLFLVALVAFDLAAQRRLHRITIIGVTAVVASEFVVSWIYHAPGWLPIARAIVTPLPGPPITG